MASIFKNAKNGCLKFGCNWTLISLIENVDNFQSWATKSLQNISQSIINFKKLGKNGIL